MTRPPHAPTSVRLAIVALTALSTLAATTLPSAPAAAQDRAAAKKVYKDAKKAYAAGEFAKAAELFKEAYGYDPKPELLFNIGQALKEANDVIAAADYLQRFLAEKPDAPNRDEVAEQVFELQQLIAVQAASVMIQGNKEGLQVFVDGEDDPRCVTPCLLTLTPLEHTVTVTDEGLAPDTKTFTPEAGGETTLRFAPGAPSGAMGKLHVKASLKRGDLFLDGRQFSSFPMPGPIDLEVGPYPASIKIDGKVVWSGSVQVAQDETTELDLIVVENEVESTSGGSASTMTVAGISLGAAGVAALGAGMFFGLSASAIETDLDAQLTKGLAPDSDLIDQGESQALYANVFYGVGVIALGTGIALWLLDGGDSETASADARDPGFHLIAAPQQGGGMVGLGLDY